jgi:uncharacterized OsmC-like protein
MTLAEILEFFEKNPEKELTARDIALGVGRSIDFVRMTLKRMRERYPQLEVKVRQKRSALGYIYIWHSNGATPTTKTLTLVVEGEEGHIKKLARLIWEACHNDGVKLKKYQLV